MAMTFKEAAAYILPLGKTYYGRSLDDIASSDTGLKYLDWLSGEAIRSARLREALDVYLSDPAIKKEVEALR